MSREGTAVAEAPTARKVQISVPTADTTVIEWLELQYAASESIRRLIRESVAREGFTDVANRPVRPPAQPVHVAEDFPADIEAVSYVEVSPVADADSDVAPAPSAAEAEESTTPTRRSVRSDDTDATATIDDLLGL